MNRSPEQADRNHPVVLSTIVALATVATGAVLLSGPNASADTEQLRAVIKDPSGAVVGKVDFAIDDDDMTVRVRIRPNQNVTPGSFHGLHVHANDNPANGSGCVADPAQPRSTWFTAVDGHFAEVGQTHGHHKGDLPSPLVQADGTATMQFTTDRIAPAELVGRAIILHFGADNFGNIPVGDLPDQYKPNDPAATTKTANTGNAGDRVACGVVVKIA
jgi:Cu-Zn family superoxide dismutase